MVDLSERATAAELIDDPAAVTAPEMEQVLRELELVNRWLGGTSTSMKAVAPLLGEWTGRSPIRVTDVGTGSADIPLALAQWCRRRNLPVQILAIDSSPAVCRLARHSVADCPEICVVRGDVSYLPLSTRSTDLILCSAFLHHFSNRQLTEIISRLRECATTAIVINDLQRHRVAYWSIRLLTRLFSRSPAVRHDGPLSVRKGFHRRELVDLLESAGCRDFEIRWRWAFRWVVTVRV